MKKMKRWWLLALMITISIGSICAQEIKVKSFKKSDFDLFAKTSERLDNNNTPCAVIKVITIGKNIQFSGMIVGATTQDVGMVIVYVAEGTSKITIKHADYGVLTYQLPEKVVRHTTYKLKLQLIKSSRDKLRSIVIPTLGYSEAQTSYGIMLGLVKKSGGYIRTKWDLNNFKTDIDSRSEESLKDGQPRPWYTGKSKRKRLAITAGYVQRITPPLYLYFGAGYGYRVLAWETIDELLVKQIDHSYDGIEAELGIILRMGGIALSAGLQSNSFEYMEANFGIGFIF